MKWGGDTDSLWQDQTLIFFFSIGESEQRPCSLFFTALRSTIFLEVLPNCTHPVELKEQLCSFSYETGVVPETKPESGLRNLMCTLRRLSQQEVSWRKNNTFPKAIIMERILTTKGEKINRSNKKLQPKSPNPSVGGSEPVLYRTTYLHGQGQSQAERAQVIQGKRNWSLGSLPWRSSLSS